MHGNETHVRVFDIATLYHTTSGKVTTNDLPQAATPTAVLDKTSGWLTGMSETMQYSLDGGKTWVFAGGTSVLLNLDKIKATEILIKDIGTSSFAPSDIQSISLIQEGESPEQNTKPTLGAGTIAAIVIGSVVVVGTVALVLFKRKRKI